MIRADGRGLGVVSCDVNLDGWPDFYVANDGDANHLYLGRADLSLTEAGFELGVAFDANGVAQGGMGVDQSDYDRDGDFDLWVTNFELQDNALYENSDSSLFSYATLNAGLGGQSRMNVGFGTGFADFDSDGWEDLFVVNGHVRYRVGRSAYLQRPALYRNQRGIGFQDVTPSGGSYFQMEHAARGAAVGDLDNDGALDLVVVHQNRSAVVLRNRLRADNWVRLKLQGTRAGRDAAFGSIVSLAGSRPILSRSLASGAGYLSQFDVRLISPFARPQSGQGDRALA